MELRCAVLWGFSARANRVCWATERRARMGSRRGNSLSASSWECCLHCWYTSSRVEADRGLESGGVTRGSSVECVFTAPFF